MLKSQKAKVKVDPRQAGSQNSGRGEQPNSTTTSASAKAAKHVELGTAGDPSVKENENKPLAKASSASTEPAPIQRPRAQSLSTSRLQLTPDRIVLCSHSTDVTAYLLKWLQDESHGRSRTVEKIWSPHFVVIDTQPRMLYALDVGKHSARDHDQIYQNGEGFVLCYSANDRESFSTIERFDTDILRARNGNKPPITLVSVRHNDQERTVTRAEGRLLGRKIGAPFVEVRTGSTLKDDILGVFEITVRQIRDAKVAEEKEPAALPLSNQNRRTSLTLNSECLLM